MLENGLKPIVRKVQDANGYESYAQYEADVRRGPDVARKSEMGTFVGHLPFLDEYVYIY